MTMTAPAERAICGLLVIDKPRGCTSHDVVNRVRRALGTRRVGHAGTLDPMATGVLIVLVGEATKLAPYLTLETKSYRATIALGVTTDTLDAEGKETERNEVGATVLDALRAIERGADVAAQTRLAEALELERARAAQVPPAVSAIHVDGRRSYELARAGVGPTLPPRLVSVARLEVVGATAGPPSIEVELSVSKGYYVRALARDLAERLGTVGHLTALRRTTSGSFTLEGATSLDDRVAIASLETRIVPLATAAARALPQGRLTETGTLRARQGKQLATEDFAEAPPDDVASAWLAPDGQLVAIGGRPSGGAPFAVLRGFSAAPS